MTFAQLARLLRWGRPVPLEALPVSRADVRRVARGLYGLGLAHVLVVGATCALLYRGFAGIRNDAIDTRSQLTSLRFVVCSQLSDERRAAVPTLQRAKVFDEMRQRVHCDEFRASATTHERATR